MSSLTPVQLGVLRWHLEHNHVPPIPRTLHRFAIRAIELQGSDDAVSCGSAHLIDQEGNPINASHVCDAWHLWDFVDMTKSELGLTPMDTAELRQVEKEITGE